MGSVGKSLGNGVMDVLTLGGSYQQRKASKEQTRAANAMADAMENAPKPTVEKVIEQQTQAVTDSTQATKGAAARRYSLSKTNTGGLNGGLKKTLG
ncbi:hypothetical protein ICN84_07845 [Akkermansia glycaniphila]|uniref:hypothetical protein n=1 Tax=Akkermansia glycaniphila TaxID=1679444 RepID=UPI001C009D3D|nr:hypothetical protein [Akkermansia glycaniphila]MBT9449985.1 hypothetical protein [Akkermansia glycaniphila]